MSIVINRGLGFQWFAQNLASAGTPAKLFVLTSLFDEG